jgi:hypothetical protein
MYAMEKIVLNFEICVSCACLLNNKMCFRHLELFLINIITVNFSEENGRSCKKDKPFWKLLINVLA